MLRNSAQQVSATRIKSNPRASKAKAGSGCCARIIDPSKILAWPAKRCKHVERRPREPREHSSSRFQAPTLPWTRGDSRLLWSDPTARPNIAHHLERVARRSSARPPRCQPTRRPTAGPDSPRWARMRSRPARIGCSPNTNPALGYPHRRSGYHPPGCFGRSLHPARLPAQTYRSAIQCPGFRSGSLPSKSPHLRSPHRRNACHRLKRP